VLTDHIATEPGCDAGWYSFGDRCYKFVMQNKIQFWALEYCRDLGGQLATVYNDQVNAFINAKINEKSSDAVSILFKLSVVQIENQFFTVDFEIFWFKNEQLIH